MMTGDAADAAARSRYRVRVIQVIGLALMVVLGGRLWYLQTVASQAYAQAADANTVREIVTPAARGLILDSAGRPLVRNRTRLQVTVDRSALARRADRGAAVLASLAPVVGLSLEELRDRLRPCSAGADGPCWNGSPYQPVPVLTEADSDIALRILERRERFPGVDVVPVGVRAYPRPSGANLVHVLGYLQPADPDDVAAQRAAGRPDPRLGVANLVGRAGLERQYDALLRGEPGVRRVSVDHLGRVLAPISDVPAVPGNSLVTTLDAQLQAVAEQELRRAIERARHEPDFRGRVYPADGGAIVVMDVTDGAIVAMASSPRYGPSVWVDGIAAKTYDRLSSPAAGTALLSRATGVAAPPASTFKLITTAAAAEAGYDLDAAYPCPSSYAIGEQQFRNFESASYGPISLARALELSCDTVFYRIAHEMWMRDGGATPVARPRDPIQAMAAEFGLGRRTGIDLPGEDAGRIATRDFKRRYWERTREATCARAEAGYAELARAEPERAAYLHALDRENCTDGAVFRAGDAANLAIGQGDTLVTPLQMARAYAAIANGGTLWRPRLAKAELTPEGELVRRFDPVSDGRVGIAPATLDYLRAALQGVSIRGTAAGVFRGWPLAEVPVGAKTGTAERFGEDPTSWFIGFAGPQLDLDRAAEPRYVVAMTVTHGGTGSGTSGPGVRAVLAAAAGIDRQPVLPGGLPRQALPAPRPEGGFLRPERVVADRIRAGEARAGGTQP